jgi:hypothetical protein
LEKGKGEGRETGKAEGMGAGDRREGRMRGSGGRLESRMRGGGGIEQGTGEGGRGGGGGNLVKQHTMAVRCGVLHYHTKLAASWWPDK